MQNQTWYLYLLLCRNNALYSGITTNPPARFALHRASKGAKYTRMHPPLEMRIVAIYDNRSTASKAEIALKKMRAAQKRALWQNAEPLPLSPKNHTEDVSYLVE